MKKNSHTNIKIIHEENTPTHPLRVCEEKNLRWLDFGNDAIQSHIDLNDAAHLPSPVYRAMLAALLFIDTPKKVLMLGTGGGAIARFFHHLNPDIHGDAIEYSQAVASIARRFFYFPNSTSHWHLHITDARDYIKTTDQQYDLTILDIVDGLQTPQWLSSPDLLQQCHNHLSSGGVLVTNIMPEGSEHLSKVLMNIRQVFDLKTVCLSVPEYHNILVFAFIRSASTSCRGLSS